MSFCNNDFKYQYDRINNIHIHVVLAIFVNRFEITPKMMHILDSY
jgi:hypothetical protein